MRRPFYHCINMKLQSEEFGGTAPLYMKAAGQEPVREHEVTKPDLIINSGGV
jgi:hypothetical protein